MEYRPARDSDLEDLATFVGERMRPALQAPDLTPRQRQETEERLDAMTADGLRAAAHSIFVGYDESASQLVALLTLDRRGRGPVTVDQFLISEDAAGRRAGRDLWQVALDDIAPQRGAQMAVEYHRTELLALLEEAGFERTGETVGDFEVGRILMLLPGVPAVVEQDEPVDDFPSEADEPYFEPVYAALPDYQLAAEELSQEVLFDPETTSLDREQIDEVSRFIEQARRRKAARQQEKPSDTARANRHPHIVFEVDYGEADTPAPRSSLEFEFAFDAESNTPAPGAKKETPTEEDVLELREIPDAPSAVTPADLRAEFEDKLGERLTDFFGPDELPRYLEVYRNADNFHHIRDVSLHSLSEWINGRPPGGRVDRRKRRVIGELIEYFIVEPAAGMHDHQFPQKVLRYQGVAWERVDLFRMVMDYLDFSAVEDQLYTDFATIAPKVMKRATENYLTTSADERLFFICDQSLFQAGKQGFAMTDAGIYWKNVLQPAGAATYTTIRSLQVREDYLLIDGQYFDAGKKLNLQVALLLDKLRRLDPPK